MFEEATGEAEFLLTVRATDILFQNSEDGYGAAFARAGDKDEIDNVAKSLNNELANNYAFRIL